MFASGISSSAQQNIASFQAQQQQKIQQQFQSLAAEFQSGGLSTAQTTALQQENLPTSGSSVTSGSSATTPTSSSPSCAQSAPAHWHHRPHIRMDSDSSNSDSQTTDPLEQMFSGDSSSAQQAYSTLGSTPANTSATQSVSLTV